MSKQRFETKLTLNRHEPVNNGVITLTPNVLVSVI